jgi:hypothetical protein
VRRATGEDEPVIAALLGEAVEWLGERGVDQWPSPYPAHIVRASIGRGEMYLAFLDKEAVATRNPTPRGRLVLEPKTGSVPAPLNGVA